MDFFLIKLHQCSFIPTIIASIYALILFRELTPELKLFSGYIFIAGLVEAASKILSALKINNMPLLHVFVGGGFFFICLFYKRIFKGYINSKLMTGILIAFLVFTTINSFFFQSIFYFNSNALTVEAVLIIIITLSAFIFILNDSVKKEHSSILTSLYWINSGLFLYYTSSLIIFYFGVMITTAPRSNQTNYTWVLHSVFSMLMYSCFIIGLWNRPRKLA